MVAEAIQGGGCKRLRFAACLVLAALGGCGSEMTGAGAYASPGLSTATVSPETGVRADGVETATVTVVLRRQNGTPVPGRTVQLTATGSNNALVQPGVTDANGTATGTIASTTAEPKTITVAFVQGAHTIELTQHPTVVFVDPSAPISAELSSATASPTSVIASGEATATITVTVRDLNGNAVPDQAVQLAASGSNNTLVQPGVTDASGLATGTIATTTAETKTITVTVNPGPGEIVVAQQPTVAFVGDPDNISAGLSTAVAWPATDVVANGVATSTVTITVRDVHGNAVAGQSVALSSTGADNTLVQPGLTDGNGVTTGTIASIKAGTKTITATVNPGVAQVVVGQQPDVVFVGDPDNLSPLLSSAAASPQDGVIANGAATSTITVTVRDVNGNAVAGQSVQLASTGSSNTIVQPGATDGNGVATGTIASTRAETKTLTVTVDPGPGEIVVAAQPTVGFVGDPDNVSASLSTVAAAPTTDVVANGVTTSTITVTVRDVHGNAVPGLGVALASTGSNNTFVQPGATDGNGVATGAIASTRAELKTITATVAAGAGPVVLTQEPTVGFVGDPDHLSASLSTAVATPAANVDADGVTTSTLTITVRDQNGNVVGGQAVSLASTGADNTLVQPGVTDAGGVATGTIATLTPETKTITATINPGAAQIAIAQQPTVVFVPPVVSASLSTVTVSPAFGVAANGIATATISVTVRSTNNVPLSGRSLQIAANGAGNTLVQPAATDGSGAAEGSIKSTVGENKTITVTADPGAGQVVLSLRPVVAFVAINSKVFYVRKSGSDSNAGTSPAAAWLTIQKAEDTMVQGDIVYVGAGTYEEALLIQGNGSLASRITYRADVTGSRTGDAGAVVVTAPGDNAIFIDSADHITVEGFTVTGSQTGIRMSSGPIGVLVRDCVVHGCSVGVSVESGTPVTLENNRISNNGDGITVLAGTLTIRNNLVYNNGGHGVSIIGGTLTVLSNTVHGNAGSNIRFGGGFTTLTNNLITNSLASGLDRKSGTVTGSFNLVWGNVTDYSGLSAGTGDISLNPFYVDVDGADNLLGGSNGADDMFQLDAAMPSPALDAGSAAATTFLLADGSSLADRTTRSDAALDGTSPDGATVNMGYHYGIAVSSPPSLLVNDVRLFYGEGSSRQPRLRTWDHVASAWSAEALALPAGSTIYWTQHAVSPLLDDCGLLAMLSGTGSSTELDMLRWNGTEWSLDWSSTSIAAANAQKRGFDVAYEQSSGDALVVYANNSNQPRFRTRQNGAWSNEAAVTTAPLAGVVQWVQLASRPGSNEIVLCYSDSSADLAVLVWSGSAWTAATSAVLEVNLKTNSGAAAVSNRVFDVAYEAATGDLLVAWCRATTNGIWYSTKLATSNTWAPAASLAAVPTNGVPHFVDLASEPGGSRIACCAVTLDGQERLGLATWNGTAWVDAGEYDAQIRDVNNSATGDFPAAVAWVGTSGTAVCVYADDQTDTIDWASWTAGAGWVVQSDVAVAGKGYTESLDLQSFATVDDVMLVVSDSNSDLFAFTFTGTGWAVTNGSLALETSLSSVASRPFGFAVKPQ